MRKFTLLLPVSNTDRRDAALVAAGLSPKVRGLKPGNRIEVSGKSRAKQRHAKHRTLSFD